MHFTVEDLARTTFMCAPAPLVETVLSLVQVRRRIPPAGNRWSSRGGPTLPDTVRPVLELIPAFGYWPEFLDPAVADLEEGLETVQQGLRDCHAVLVAPRWKRILALFGTGLTRDMSNLATHGLAGGAGTLHSGLVWREGSLVRTVHGGLSGDFWLEGKGIQLVPSVTWNGPPLLSINARRPPWNALIYPLPRNPAHQLREGPPDLGRLLGRTRAAALEAIRDPSGTVELAGRLEISAASASEHAAALREAGLVRTTRCGRSVRHSLTPLGLSLLDGS